MKRLIMTLGCAALLAALVCGCGDRGGKKTAAETESADTMAVGWDNLPDEPVFDIVTTMGTIKVRLYSKTPKHRDNFVKLARLHYYDGVLFHRVIKDFMIQAGDPLTKDPSKADAWGTGGPDYTIPAEFVPQYYHKKGALAAARRGDAANPKRASHGSQFYIVQGEYNCLQLDGEYTVFGETLQGFSVIDRIAAVQTDRQDRPLRNVKILSVTLSEDQNPEPESPDSPAEDYDFDFEEEAAAPVGATEAAAENTESEVGKSSADTTETKAPVDTAGVKIKAADE